MQSGHNFLCLGWFFCNFRQFLNISYWHNDCSKRADSLHENLGGTGRCRQFCWGKYLKTAGRMPTKPFSVKRSEFSESFSDAGTKTWAVRSFKIRRLTELASNAELESSSIRKPCKPTAHFIIRRLWGQSISRIQILKSLKFVILPVPETDRFFLRFLKERSFDYNF